MYFLLKDEILSSAFVKKVLFFLFLSSLLKDDFRLRLLKNNFSSVEVTFELKYDVACRR